MAEPRELFRLLDAAGRQLTFPEEALPHEGSRRLLEFLGVKIVKSNAQIDADLQARFGEKELTVRCQPCEWSFTGPTTVAIAEQRTHSESAEHARGLLDAMDRRESLPTPKPRGDTMGEKTCEACGFEQAPTHGRYAGIGAACRRNGFYRKDGQIHSPGKPPADVEPEPEDAIDVPVERKVPEPVPAKFAPEPEPERPIVEPDFTEKVERFINAGVALGGVVVRHAEELAAARAECDAAHAALSEA